LVWRCHGAGNRRLTWLDATIYHDGNSPWVTVFLENPMGLARKEAFVVSQTANAGMVILDPTSPPLAVHARLATRPSDLNGKVLGLLNNSKLNAANLLDEVGELLSERYQFAKVIKGSKPNASTPCPEAIVKEFAASCDVLVTSNGD
jgi:hypothetical protein